jgi:iron complex transport system substrate-binding protein
MFKRPARARLGAATLSLTLLTSLALGACSAPGTVATAAEESSAPQPVSEKNCGRQLHFDTAPTRIVSLWPAVTEMLIALGAKDRIVGQAFTDQSPPLSEYADAYKSIPVLATNSVSRETLLNSRPELIVADGEYHFNGTELPAIEDLNKLGVQVYIISSFCNGETTTGHVTDAADDLGSLGRIVGAEGTAKTLIDAQKAELEKAAQKIARAQPVPLSLVQFYDNALYADARGLYSDVVERAGGKNIYENDLPAGQYYAQIAAEDLARKNPGTLVYLYNSEEDKAAQLAAIREKLPTVDAVKNNRLYPLPSTDFIGSRAVDGVRELSALLHP